MSRATFGTNTGPILLPEGDVLVEIIHKDLPEGSWAGFGIANMVAGNGTFAPHRDTNGDAHCELHQGNFFLGQARNRELVTADDNIGKRTLSMFGGAQVPSGGGPVSLWCSSQFGGNEYNYQINPRWVLGSPTGDRHVRSSVLWDDLFSYADKSK